MMMSAGATREAMLQSSMSLVGAECGMSESADQPLDLNNNDISEQMEPTVTSNEFRESIRKIELFLKQSDFLFDSDDIALFSKFKSRLDLIE